MQKSANIKPSEYSTNQLWLLTLAPVIACMFVGSCYGYVLGRELCEFFGIGWLLTHFIKLGLSLVGAQLGGSFTFATILAVLYVFNKCVYKNLFSK